MKRKLSSNARKLPCVLSNSLDTVSIQGGVGGTPSPDRKLRTGQVESGRLSAGNRAILWRLRASRGAPLQGLSGIGEEAFFLCFSMRLSNRSGPGSGRPDRSPLHSLSLCCSLGRQMVSFSCCRTVICVCPVHHR